MLKCCQDYALSVKNICNQPIPDYVVLFSHKL